MCFAGLFEKLYQRKLHQTKLLVNAPKLMTDQHLGSFVLRHTRNWNHLDQYTSPAGIDSPIEILSFNNYQYTSPAGIDSLQAFKSHELKQFFKELNKLNIMSVSLHAEIDSIIKDSDQGNNLYQPSKQIRSESSRHTCPIRLDDKHFSPNLLQTQANWMDLFVMFSAEFSRTC